MRKVEVVPHDPAWAQEFKAEAQRLSAALGEIAIAIHHIGSTAIPCIYAKPIIDLLLEVNDLAQLDRQQAAVEQLGYEAMGEYGIPGRRYFRKHNAAGTRTHHLHAFAPGSSHVERHLLFRDYLIAHPQDAQQYSNLKRRLAAQYLTDIESYMDGKDSLIKTLETRSVQWKRQKAEGKVI